MTKILFDSDVILDFFFDRIPYSSDTEKILYLCEKKVLEGFVSPVAISNIYYLLRKNATHDKVISSLEKLLSIVTVADMNQTIIETTLHSAFKDFEDGLQHYTAINANVQIILTRNIKDYKNSILPVMTPTDYLKLIQTEKKNLHK